MPKREDVLAAASELVGWSNSLYGSEDEVRMKRRKNIADKLGITEKIGEID